MIGVDRWPQIWREECKSLVQKEVERETLSYWTIKNSEIKNARDLTYGRQQLLWQQHITIIGSIDLDSEIDEHRIGVTFDTPTDTISDDWIRAIFEF